MLNWLTGKIRSERITVWNIQLASELSELPSAEVALVLAKAIDFCLSFRQHENGFAISKAIEEPSKHLTDDGARELYGRLEDILLTAQQQLKPTLERAKASLPPAMHDKFAKSTALNHVSLRLLMSRVAHVFKATDEKHVKQVSQCLRNALPSIDDAVTVFKSEQSASGMAKDPGHYIFVRDLAYNYAVNFPL